ncbi:MAG: 5-formyltetrahydrofolate cyclo-ligase [bacterium]
MKSDKSIQKDIIRKRIKKLRDSMNTDEINTKSSIISSILWKVIEGRKINSIMFYIAFGSEVKTQDCIIKALEKNFIVTVPVCIKEKLANGTYENNLLASKLHDFPSGLEKSKFGLLEPKKEFIRPFPPENLDIVVVPGIAFDTKGYRIGYGAGYYDNFLPKCKKALYIALAYQIQIVDNVYPESWDIPVHGIITEDGLICIKLSNVPT